MLHVNPLQRCLSVSLLLTACAPSTDLLLDTGEQLDTGQDTQAPSTSEVSSSEDTTSGGIDPALTVSDCGRFLVRPIASATCEDIAEATAIVTTIPSEDSENRLCVVDGHVKNFAQIAEIVQDCSPVYPVAACSKLTEVAHETAASLMRVTWDGQAECTSSNLVVYVLDGAESRGIDCFADDCDAVTNPHTRDVITMMATALGPAAPCTRLRIRKVMDGATGTIGQWVTAHVAVHKEILAEETSVAQYIIAGPNGWLGYEPKDKLTEHLVINTLESLAKEGVWIAAAAGNRGMGCSNDTDSVYPALYADPEVLGDMSSLSDSIVACNAVGLDGRVSSTTRPGGVFPVFAVGELHHNDRGRCKAVIGSSLAVGACTGALVQVYQAAPAKSDLAHLVNALHENGTPVLSAGDGQAVSADHGEHGIQPGEAARIVSVFDAVKSITESDDKADWQEQGTVMADFKAAYLNAITANVEYPKQRKQVSSAPCLWFDVEPLQELPKPGPTPGASCHETSPDLTTPEAPGAGCAWCGGQKFDGEVQVIVSLDKSVIPAKAKCALELSDGEQTYSQPISLTELADHPKMFRFKLPDTMVDVEADLVCWDTPEGNYHTRTPINLVDGATLSDDDFTLHKCESSQPFGGVDPCARKSGLTIDRCDKPSVGFRVDFPPGHNQAIIPHHRFDEPSRPVDDIAFLRSKLVGP